MRRTKCPVTAKRDRAVALIDAGGNARSVQVLQEF